MQDWKNPANEPRDISWSDCPIDEYELRAWFSDKMELWQLDIICNMIGQPKNDGFGDHVWKVSGIWNFILDQSIFLGVRSGWIDRKGRHYSCSYAAHDSLINDVLRKTTEEVELAGWVRISDLVGRAHVQMHGNLRPNKNQRETMKKLKVGY